MKKILYIDMDNTLVDFSARLVGIDPGVLAQYDGRYDEIPGLFAVMPPVPGAVEAFRELSELFDIYILSTAPWGNPSAWMHKVEWVKLHFGMDAASPAYKRLILSHHKNLNRGDFLVDDRPWHNGAGEFEGEVLGFGEGREFPTWAAVVDYLTQRASASVAWGDLDDEARLAQAALAEQIATQGHRGQTDKLGVDYIRHPAAVAAAFDPVEQPIDHCAGWLHDVIEDTDVSAADMLRAGIHPDVVTVVRLLTRRDGDGDAYYERIAANPAARAVKLSDIRHNTDPVRAAQLDPDTRAKLADKYAHAVELLGA